jgi:hypothetical protein
MGNMTKYEPIMALNIQNRTGIEIANRDLAIQLQLNQLNKSQLTDEIHQEQYGKYQKQIDQIN